MYVFLVSLVQDFNLAKAEKMILKVSVRSHFRHYRMASYQFEQSFEWRRLYKIDTIIEDFKPPEVLTKYIAGGCVGRDRFLNPCENINIRFLPTI